ALSRRTEAGLTSKPRHAQRPRVALRGSFRPRLAATTGDGLPATPDPGEAPPEYRHQASSLRTLRNMLERLPPGALRSLPPVATPAPQRLPWRPSSRHRRPPAPMTA